jgi:hypothetical protein
LRGRRHEQRHQPQRKPSFRKAMPEAADDERVLRAKYLDWCSARLADRFLALTPDEIYELAERSSHGREEDALVAFRASGSNGRPESSSEILFQAMTWREPENFRVLVARVTEILADTLNLPPYEVWAEAYREAPERFEHELLGFWRESN